MNALRIATGFAAVAIAPMLVGSATAAPDALLYEETFTGPTSNVVDYGWRYFVGYSDGVLYNENTWQGVASVNTGGGYVFVGGSGSGNETLFYTEEASIDRSLYENLMMSWTNESDSTSEQYRAAVRVGGQWYASTIAQSIGVGMLSFDLDSDLSALNVTSTGITLGAAAALPAGNIEAFGILFMDQIGNARYDNVQVTGDRIPEPAAATLLLLGSMGLAVARRRRPA